MTESNTPPEASAPRLPTILCVDDEPNILSALKRLFRGKGWQVLSAEGGQAALALLETQNVDLVISDMRMPEMDGAQFLAQVRARWPDTVRLLLTGHTDINAIIKAINRGEIYRYITKPWDDNDILLLVKHALERRALELEKNRLEALTREQNAALTALNQSLEAKVAERTAELSASRDTIIEANKKLKSNFITTIKIFSSMIEMRGGNLAGHSRRVADLARQLAVKLDMPAPQTQEVFIAALLLDIGKIGFSDDLLALPLSLITGDKLGLFRKHPLRAEQLLMPLEDLRGAATVLRAHMERWDGSGFPDAIAGDLIPLGARILALASDYDSLQHGALVQRRVLPADARQIIYDSAGKRYDPAVVAAFRALLDGEPVERVRDLAAAEGLMLLAADHVLDQRMIASLRDYEAKNEVRLYIWIWPPKEK